MKLFALFCILLVGTLFLSSTAAANDFEWMKACNIRAEADESGFRLRLKTRFKIGDTQVDAVLSNVDEPADAYMLLRLGEISKKPMDDVIKKYESKRGKGWGVIAKSLGIKPGSKEFHDLKSGQDLYTDTNKKSKGAKKPKDKSRGKG